MRRGSRLCLLVVILALFLPEVAAACEGCTIYRVCIADDCWWTSLCGPTSYPNAGWTECDDSVQPCQYGGPKCKWVSAPKLKKDSDAPPANS